MFARGPVRSASLRIIIPVGLTVVLFVLSVFFLFIPSIEKQMMNQKREMIRRLTDSAWSLLSIYNNRLKEGELSLKEAQSRAIQQLRGMRYGPEGKDYFWINDMMPQMVMHPHRPDLEGKDLTDYTDPKGKRLFVEFVKIVQEHGAGYVDYVWQWKDKPDRMVPKISYVRAFKPWGWIIGTGIYVEDVRSDIAAITERMALICSVMLALVLALSFFIIWQTIKTEAARREAEKGLTESEEDFRALGEDAPFGISITNRDQQHEYINPEFTRMFGYRLTDIPDKKTWFEKAYPDTSYREKVISTWNNDIIDRRETQKASPRVFTVRCRDGEDKIISFRAVNMENGKHLLTCQDITERARMETSLKESEQKYIQLYEESKRREEVYRSLLSSSADAIVIYDTEGNAQYVSPAFTQIFGWTSKEVEGKRIPFLPESEAEDTLSIIRELVDHGTPCRGFETKRFTKDGRILDVSISASRYDDHEGQAAGMLVILRDISERKALESQFYEAQKMESIGTLAGGVAHDFNNLLMAMQGNVSLLLLDKDASDPDVLRLKNIEEHIRRGAYLTKQLLGFARGGKYEIKPTNLNEVAERSADLFARMKKEIRIHANYQQGIWMIEADQGQIEQVLMNLYVNAGHAMPDGGDLFIVTENTRIDRHMTSAGLKPGRYVKISVTDTGVGMDADIQQKIFDPFFTTREVGQGTGLGLASAYGIIKNHNGSITVRSSRGKGTTFDVYLPAIDAPKPARSEVSETSPEMETGGETVLLVDDEEIVIDVGADMLERLGYSVLTAKSGEEALKQYRDHRDMVDLVILDMVMPGTGAAETYQKLKKEDPDIVVLLSSGYSVDGQATEILSLGCNGFIQKPFSIASLSQKMRELLSNPSARGNA